MKSIQNVPWLASTSLLLLAAIPASNFSASSPRAGDDLTFHSVAGRKLDKHFVQHSELNLTSVSSETPDGPDETDGQFPSMKLTDDETIEFCDETLSAGEGQPKKLKRSFSTIDNSYNAESDAEDFEGGLTKNESGLLAKTVVFTWDSDEKAFSSAWFECEGDDDLLKPMVEDADFRGWLPGKKVDEGDTWTIPVSEFKNLQEPSGPMGYKPEGETEAPDDKLADGLRDSRKGEIKATYKGTREEGGVKVGVIAFVGKLDAAFEQDMEKDAEAEGVSSGKLSAEQSDELEGEILWDIAAGHFVSLTCDAVIKSTHTSHYSFEFEGSAVSFSETQVYEGKKTYRFTCAEKKD